MAEPRYAKQISSATCPHGNVHILLHDENGEVFAVAALPLEPAADFLEQLGSDCEAALAIAQGAVVAPAGELH
jgi:hypothetical protein